MNILVAVVLMTGAWEGQARPVNDFLAQKPVPVILTIGADGAVEGTLGSAKMIDARFRPRAWYEREGHESL
jgi:hypothetical protein